MSRKYQTLNEPLRSVPAQSQQETEKYRDLNDAASSGAALSELNELEASLVSRILARDRRAFQELYEGYWPHLSRFVMRLVKRPPLVEEVVNDTMMVVWDGLDRFNGDSRLSTWVFAIAYRKGMKALSRNDDPVEDADETLLSAEPSSEQSAADAQRHDALRRAMDQLSADHRAVVDLTYFHEMGYREIAVIMDCPVDTVKTRMFHARRNLKQLLSGDKSDWL
jgi:RNA polymerase sigma factor (sigma-70 family)